MAYTLIFLLKNVSNFAFAIATHIFSEKIVVNMGPDFSINIYVVGSH